MQRHFGLWRILKDSFSPPRCPICNSDLSSPGLDLQSVAETCKVHLTTNKHIAVIDSVENPPAECNFCHVIFAVLKHVQRKHLCGMIDSTVHLEQVAAKQYCLFLGSVYMSPGYASGSIAIDPRG
jgi:hypothetical protein